MKGGFFTKEETSSVKISKVPQSCASCGLSKKARNGRIRPWGKGRKGILIIAGSPSESDDRKKQPWSDKKGDLMKEALSQYGINLYRDCITTFACRCPAPKGKPEDRQIACCHRKLSTVISEFKSKLIFLVDDAAVKSVIGSRWKKGLGGDDGIMARWRGWTIPDRDLNTWIVPIFSPGYVDYREEKGGKNLAKVIWLSDIKNALNKLNQSFSFINELKYVNHITDHNFFKKAIKRILRADLLSFDYEGTGLKPHAKGHEITTVSACISPKECYVWDNTPERFDLWQKVLKSDVKKSAHNLGFEDLWSNVIFKTPVNAWHWDSMINAHILDNRQGINSLKFQTYVNFGLMGYESEIEPYLKGSDSKNANSINTILQFIKKYGSKPVRDYCGLDSIYGMMLTRLQMESMGYGLPKI